MEDSVFEELFFHPGDRMAGEFHAFTDLLCCLRWVFDEGGVHRFFFLGQIDPGDVLEQRGALKRCGGIFEVEEMAEDGGEIEEPVDVAGFKGEDHFDGVLFVEQSEFPEGFGPYLVDSSDVCVIL